MKQELLEYLNARIKECESSAEEFIQERSNKEDADRMTAMAEAYSDVILFIQEKFKDAV